MKVDSTHEIKASRERVYAALIDPDVLRLTIPGCESLEKVDENHYTAKMKAGVGPIKGNFAGDVRLEDMRPPEHYRIVVTGKGAVGFAKGSADFDLEEKDGGTLIRYSGEMQIGGSIAGVGQRMIQGAAKMMASQFFAKLEAEVKNRQRVLQPPAATTTP